MNQQQQIHPGQQFIRAIDSIGANIAEGFGRFHYLDSVKFYYYSRGSIFESKYWLRLLVKRKMIDQQTFMIIGNKLEKQGLKLNNLINSIKNKTNPDNK